MPMHLSGNSRWDIHLSSLPTLRPPAAHAPSLGSLQVARRNPTLIVSLATSGDRGSISTNDRHLLRRVDLLRLAGRALSALAALAAATLLREECRDPGIVDEVAGAAEGCEKEEVEEDAARSN